MWRERVREKRKYGWPANEKFNEIEKLRHIKSVMIIGLKAR